MININIELIKKFINNEDLGEYSREQLCNSAEFMTALFEYTNNYRYFYCCSPRLRQNLGFIENILLKSNSISFIINMTRCYLATSDNETDRFELRIIAERLLPFKDGQEFRYANSLSYFTVIDQLRNEDFETMDIDLILRDRFSRIMEKIDNEIILNYFATKMVNEIYEENKDNFYKYLDEEYSSIRKYTDEYIAIRFISEVDSSLAKYLNNHFEPLRRVINAIELKRKFSGDSSLERLESVNETIHEYMVKTGKENREEELLYYVLRKGGIAVRYAFANQMSLDETRKGNEDDKALEYVILNDRELKETVSNIKKIIVTEVYRNKPVDVNKMISISNNILKYKPKNGDKE